VQKGAGHEMKKAGLDGTPILGLLASKAATCSLPIVCLHESRPSLFWDRRKSTICSHCVFDTHNERAKFTGKCISPCAGYPSKMDGWMIGNGEVESLLKRQGSKPRVISIAQA
jgi:hypothetical protein